MADLRQLVFTQTEHFDGYIKAKTGLQHSTVNIQLAFIAIFQNTRDLSALNPESGDNCQTLLHEVIHTGQALTPATGGQRVHDEIH